jgi:hypothetical protein
VVRPWVVVAAGLGVDKPLPQVVVTVTCSSNDTTEVLVRAGDEALPAGESWGCGYGVMC